MAPDLEEPGHPQPFGSRKIEKPILLVSKNIFEDLGSEPADQRVPKQLDEVLKSGEGDRQIVADHSRLVLKRSVEQESVFEFSRGET